MKKSIQIWIVLLLAMVCMVACTKSPVEVSPSPTQSLSTPAPSQATMVPTPTPNIPPVDETYPAIETLSSLAMAELPNDVRMHYQHESGQIAPAKGALHQGNGYSIYLLQNLGDLSCVQFIAVKQGESDRILPDRDQSLDTGEGITLSYQQISTENALSSAILLWEKDGFYTSLQEDLSQWNDLYGFDLDPALGALPYDGTYAVLETIDTTVRIFAIAHGNGTWLITMYTYEPIDQPPMFHYLCAMLSSIRFQ